MVWNITQDTVYATALEAQYQKRMSNLRHRSDELESLSHTVEDQIAPSFKRSAPLWGHHRKSLDRVETFLFGLLKSRKLSAHQQCMAAWGEVIHAKPSSFYDLLYIANLPRITKPESHFSNPLFSKSDAFNTLNAYLALDPMGCLEQPGLLSGEWVEGLKSTGKSDAAMVAIMSAYYRFGDQKDGISEGYSKGRMAYVKELLVKIGESSGHSFNELVALLPVTSKASPIVSKFYRNMVECGGGTPGGPLPYAFARLHNVIAAPELLNFAMKARLLATPAHDKYLGRRDKKEEDSVYYFHCIDNPYVTASQLKVVLNSKSLEKGHIEEMHAKGLAIPYIKALAEEDRYALIERGIVPATMLSRARDRGHLLENALGL